MKPLLRAVTLIVPLALWAEPDGAPVYSRASLLERAPFAKPDKAGKVSAGGPLELRGFFGAGESLEVSLSKSGTAESVWARVGDKNAKWPVESADPVAGTADVRYDGLLLHLKLARPETPDLTVKPAAPAPERDARSARRGGWSNLSPATREILGNAMRESMESLQKTNPEYFDGTKLTPEQRKAFADTRAANYAKVREQVAKVAPDDLPRLDEMHERMNARFSEHHEGGRSAGPAPEKSDAPAPANP